MTTYLESSGTALSVDFESSGIKVTNRLHPSLKRDGLLFTCNTPDRFGLAKDWLGQIVNISPRILLCGDGSGFEKSATSICLIFGIKEKKIVDSKEVELFTSPIERVSRVDIDAREKLMGRLSQTFTLGQFCRNFTPIGWSATEWKTIQETMADDIATEDRLLAESAEMDKVIQAREEMRRLSVGEQLARALTAIAAKPAPAP